MPLKQRTARPVIGDTLQLQLHTFNASSPASLDAVLGVEILAIDAVDPTLPLRQVAMVEAADIEQDGTGQYIAVVELESDVFTVGRYIDRWHVRHVAFQPNATIDQGFEVFRDAWFSASGPLLYDFRFQFRPNRLRKGSRQNLRVTVTPNIVEASDLADFYLKAAAGAVLTATLEQRCVPCMPPERDLRIAFEDVPIDLEGGHTGALPLDTADLAAGVYDLSFKLTLGESIHLSPRMQVVVHE